jgi:hypothetical protein
MFRVLQERAITINNYPAYQRVYSWFRSDYNVSVTQIQTWVMAEDDMYLITASSLSELYPAYESDLLKIIDSFKSQ